MCKLVHTSDFGVLIGRLDPYADHSRSTLENDPCFDDVRGQLDRLVALSLLSRVGGMLKVAPLLFNELRTSRENDPPRTIKRFRTAPRGQPSPSGSGTTSRLVPSLGKRQKPSGAIRFCASVREPPACAALTVTKHPPVRRATQIIHEAQAECLPLPARCTKHATYDGLWPASQLGVPLMQDWALEPAAGEDHRSLVLNGKIYRHPMIADGTYTVTSVLERTRERHVYTRSGSSYFLGEVSEAFRPRLLLLANCAALDANRPLQGVTLTRPAPPPAAATSAMPPPPPPVPATSDQATAKAAMPPPRAATARHAAPHQTPPPYCSPYRSP